MVEVVAKIQQELCIDQQQVDGKHDDDDMDDVWMNKTLMTPDWVAIC